MPRKTKKDKKISLSANRYRNAHHYESNQVKRKYKEEVASQLDGFNIKTPIWIQIIYYADSARKSDTSNWCFIQDKFFCDALVDLGYIEDDNTKYIPEVRYRFG